MLLPCGSAFLGARARTIASLAVALLSAALVASCASTTDGSGSKPGGLFARDPNKNVVTVANDDSTSIEAYIQQGYCPPVQVRPGTEALVIYDRGHEDDPAFIRYQGSIGQTARECHPDGTGGLSIKVGIAGRLTAGPKGGAGSATLPIRVAVVKQHGNTVFYSQVFKVPVTVVAPQFSGDFAEVADQINVQLGPGDRDLIIYVGFDEGAPKPTG
ncbi:MAG: hypothetical protein NUV72_00935 [Bauldia sp.]|nr:hypothetical protein [Bauldia sp.]